MKVTVAFSETDSTFSNPKKVQIFKIVYKLDMFELTELVAIVWRKYFLHQKFNLIIIKVF